MKVLQFLSRLFLKIYVARLSRVHAIITLARMTVSMQVTKVSLRSWDYDLSRLLLSYKLIMCANMSLFPEPVTYNDAIFDPALRGLFEFTGWAIFLVPKRELQSSYWYCTQKILYTPVCTKYCTHLYAQSTVHTCMHKVLYTPVCTKYCTHQLLRLHNYCLGVDETQSLTYLATWVCVSWPTSATLIPKQ